MMRCSMTGVVWASLAFAATGCAGEAPSTPTGRLAIDVAPLNLSGVTNADYTVAVTNGPNGTGEVVWTRALTSQRYGDGAGSLSYIGTCDAATGVNTVTLTLTALYDVNGLVPVGTFMNPTPIARQATCVANTDVAVQFDITLARQADQGFFDVAVQFRDIFCSAKLDCQDADGDDLDLLHNAAGARDMTVVMGFACTGSLTGTTFLYLDDPVIRCAGLGQDVRVDPTGLGNVSLTTAPSANASGYLFGASVYRGVEGFAGKAYWNLSFGLDATTFAAAQTCVLTARGTASDVAFPQEPGGFPLPEGSVYPVIDWQVTLSDATHRVCTTHAVNQAASGVATNYLGYLPRFNGFSWSPDPVTLKHRFEPASGIVLSAGTPICNPSCAHGVCTATDTCQCAGTGYGGPTCAIPLCAAACEHGGVCVAPDTCDCAGTGYDGATCADDVDECAAGTAPCDAHATCANTVGGFSCACNAGYTGDGTTCTDPDGCATAPCFGAVACADVAAPGSGYVCGDCPGGTWGNGEACTDCAAVAHCAGVLTCASDSDSRCTVCDAGYVQLADGADCTDIDECSTNHGGCDTHATCANTAGAHTCACDPFWTGDGVNCIDINECATANGGCGATSAWTCTNNSGAAPTCADIDECAANTDGCSPDATCTNTTGGFTCACNSGYAGDGVNCIDINECATANGGCDSHAACTNTPGSRTCACNAFWAGDGLTCTDINECATNNGGCGATSAWTCTNISGAAPSCTDINECTASTDDCSANATCTNTTGSFTCACNPGLYGNGVTCTACAAGSVQPNSGQAACVPCATGYYDNTTEVCAACTPCSAGTYQGTACTATTNRTCPSCTAVAQCAVTPTCTSSSNSVCATCNTGYTQLTAGAACTDINECSTSNGGCSANATCTNTAGSRTCACKAGFYGNGVTCTACAAGSVQPNSGQAACVPCATGYYDNTTEICAACTPCSAGTYQGTACTATTNRTCPSCTAVAQCAVTPTCTSSSNSACASCNAGYTQLTVGAACTDINECSTSNGGCSANATCTNTPGSRTCTCFGGTGYGNGLTCTYYASCLAARQAGVTASAARYVDPDGAGAAPASNVWCDMTSDGGGYTFLKVLQGSAYSAAQAETYCDTLGMSLFIPRSPAHFTSAWQVAKSTTYGADADAYYLRIMGIYPTVAGATCLNTPLRSGNPSCAWVASDGGNFFVSSLTTVAEPNGNNSPTASMYYDFDASGVLYHWDDLLTPAPTSARFICDVGDKEGVPQSCADWRALGYTASGTYTIDPDANGANAAFSVYCDMTTNGGGWTLVGRSRARTPAGTACASGDGGTNFGWKYGQGSITDDGNAYSLNVLASGLRFSKVLFGSYTTGKTWGPNVYRHDNLPADFLTNAAWLAAPYAMNAPSAVATQCSLAAGEPAMFRYLGFTDEQAFHFRDNGGSGFGLTASGWYSCYYDHCAYGGLIDGVQGMIMVK